MALASPYLFLGSGYGIDDALTEMLVFRHRTRVCVVESTVLQREDLPARPRFCVRLRIVEEQVQLQRVAVNASKPFHQVQFFAVWTADVIQPGLIVEAD